MEKRRLNLVGLRPYNEDDSESFFGREKSIERALEIFKKNKIITISGAQGSGKTSFVLSGLLKRIQSNFLGNSGREWSVCKLRPGKSPVSNLCASLSSGKQFYLNDKPKSSDFELYMQTIEEKDSYGLIKIFRESEIFAKKNLLIFIDQVEDLFKYSKVFNNELSSEDNLLIDIIYKSVKNESCSIYFILNIQAEYFSKLNIYGKFSELLSLSQFNLPNINLKKIISSANEQINFNINESVLDKISLKISEDPSHLTNFQFLLKKFSESDDLKENLLDNDTYFQNGQLEGVIGYSFENYFIHQSEKNQRTIELIFRSFTRADSENLNNFYQDFKFIMNYCEVSKKELSAIFMKINSEFGEIFDIIRDNNFSVKPKNNYLIEDSDIIILKYSNCFNWKRFNSYIKDEIIYYSQFETFLHNAQDNKEISQKELESGFELLNNENINENWSTKYNFDFQIVNEYFLKKKHAFEKQKELSITSQKRDQRNFKLKLALGIVTFLIVLVAGGVDEIKDNKIQKERNRLTDQKEKIHLLEHEKDSMIKNAEMLSVKIQEDLKFLEKSKKIIASKEYLLFQKDKEIAENGLKISEQKNDLKKFQFEVDSAIKELGVNQKFILLTKKEIKLGNEIKKLSKETFLLKPNDKSKILDFAKKSLILYKGYKALQRSKDSLIKVHKYDLEALSELTLITENNDLNYIRKLGNIMISKINGVDNITEVEDFNLLRGLNLGKKNKLNVVTVSDDKRIFAAGESGEIYYSKVPNQNLDSLTFDSFKLHSNITAIKPINSDVIVAGLKNGEIWYLSISENIKTKIFPELIREKTHEVKTIIYNQNKIYSVSDKSIIEYNLSAKKLTEIQINTDSKINQISFDNNNLFYFLTENGEIFEYDINKRSHTLIFEKDNEVLSNNDKVTRIDFYNGNFFFSTKNGWIYIFNQVENKLKYNKRILAHDSEILSLHFGVNKGKLFSSSTKGSLCVINFKENFSDMLSRIDINLGTKSIISDIESYISKNKYYILGSSYNGKLAYLSFNLDDTFDYIKKKLN